MTNFRLLFNQALETHQQGDYELAKNLYHALLNEPQAEGRAVAIIYNNLATLYYRENHFDQALAYYQKALDSDPMYAEPYLNIGSLYLKLGEKTLAFKCFENLLEYKQFEILAHQYLEHLCLDREEIETAIQHYQLVLDAFPEQVEVLNNLGVAFLKKNDPEQAILFFNRALEVDPYHLEARNNLAVLLMNQGKLKEAIWQYYLLVQESPHNIEYNYNLGVVYMLSGCLDEAEIYFQKTIEIYPQHLEAHCNLGAIYVKRYEFETAKKYYNQAQLLNPDDPRIQYCLSYLNGENSFTRTPVEYVKNLFDNYAHHFDQHLKKILEYQVPEILTQKIKIYYPKSLRKISVLDMGCGTGLMGEKLVELFAEMGVQAYLVGIDISSYMLKKAQEKAIYQELYEADILTFQISANYYHFIIAADTLVYFGDLKAIFEHVYKGLVVNGLWIFSTEKGNQMPYNLNRFGRYEHHTDYIRELAEFHHFSLLDCSEVVGRLQEGVPVKHEVFVFKKN